MSYARLLAGIESFKRGLVAMGEDVCPPRVTVDITNETYDLIVQDPDLAERASISPESGGVLVQGIFFRVVE